MKNHDSNIIIYQSDDGDIKIETFLENETVWLSQSQLGELFNKSKSTISEHIQNIFKEGELEESSVVRNFRTTAKDGKKYETKFYNLDVIISVGYRVKSLQGTKFRQWATSKLKEYLVKGFLIDSDRLKNPNGRPDYFDELLEKIRDVRASEKLFYQKVRDLFALSSDYDASDKATQMFFAQTQNKLLYAVSNKTAS